MTFPVQLDGCCPTILQQQLALRLNLAINDFHRQHPELTLDDMVAPLSTVVAMLDVHFE